MTQQYDNTNSGALFDNSRKTTANHPDFNGSLDVEGIQYWISGWKKKDRNGNTFVSLSVKPKDQQQAPTPRQAPPAQRPAPSQGQQRQAPPRGNANGGGGFENWDDDAPFANPLKRRGLHLAI